MWCWGERLYVLGKVRERNQREPLAATAHDCIWAVRVRNSRACGERSCYIGPPVGIDGMIIGVVHLDMGVEWLQVVGIPSCRPEVNLQRAAVSAERCGESLARGREPGGGAPGQGMPLT